MAPRTTSKSGEAREKKGVKTVQSVERALRILDVMGDIGRPQNLMELSQALEMNASTLYRLLTTLCRRGFVVHDVHTGSYRLSLKTYQIGQAALDSVDLRRDARPVMEALRERCNETVNLVVLQGREVIFVEQVESTNMLRSLIKVGSRAPAHATGGGKALLSGLAKAEVRALYADHPMPAYTDQTITDLARLQEELTLINRRGYAVDDEECEQGLRCVAAPVYDHARFAAGALTVTGPVGRLSLEYIHSGLAYLVMEHAQALSSRLGQVQTAVRRA